MFVRASVAMKSIKYEKRKKRLQVFRRLDLGPYFI
jgi:hypothetical protein